MNSVQYDQIDLRNAYRTGFWMGVLSGFMTAFSFCLLAGIYLNT